MKLKLIVSHSVESKHDEEGLHKLKQALTTLLHQSLSEKLPFFLCINFLCNKSGSFFTERL